MNAVEYPAFMPDRDPDWIFRAKFLCNHPGTVSARTLDLLALPRILRKSPTPIDFDKVRHLVRRIDVDLTRKTDRIHAEAVHAEQRG